MPTDLNSFIWFVFGVVGSIGGFLGIWVLTKIDHNQTELFNRMQNVEGRLSNLEGRHNAIMEMGGHK